MRFACTILFCLFFFLGNSQEQSIANSELWTSFQLNWKINKNWTFKFKNQERYYEQGSFIDLFYFQGEIGRTLSKKHKLLFRYRYTSEGREEHNMNRYSLGYVFKTKLSEKFNISERLMFQYEERVFTREPFVKLRNKIGLEYELTKKEEIEFEYELFLQEDGGWTFDKHRLNLKYSRKLSSMVSARLALRVDGLLKVEDEFTRWIFDVGFRFKL